MTPNQRTIAWKAVFQRDPTNALIGFGAAASTIFVEGYNTFTVDEATEWCLKAAIKHVNLYESIHTRITKAEGTT